MLLIGDYSDKVPMSLTLAERAELTIKETRLFDLASREYKEVTENRGNWLNYLKFSPIPNSLHLVFINLDEEELLDPVAFGNEPQLAKFVMEPSGVMKALFSVLFFSSGGEDFHCNSVVAKSFEEECQNLKQRAGIKEPGTSKCRHKMLTRSI